MQDTLNTPETNPDPTETASRRAFLTQVAALGAGALALPIVARAQTAMGQTPMTPGTMTPGTMPMTPGMAMPMADPTMPGMMPPAMPKNEMQYRMAIAPIAQLSLATSQIAVLKAVDPMVRQFATFELAEAVAVTNVLKELGTPMPPMSAMDMATLDRAKNTPAGPDFDRDYITKQAAAHMYLRDTATNYLAAPLPRKAKMPEQHGRHLATINLPTFIEHVTHTTDIMARMMTTA